MMRTMTTRVARKATRISAFNNSTDKSNTSRRYFFLHRAAKRYSLVLTVHTQTWFSPPFVFLIIHRFVHTLGMILQVVVRCMLYMFIYVLSVKCIGARLCLALECICVRTKKNPQ